MAYAPNYSDKSSQTFDAPAQKPRTDTHHRKKRRSHRTPWYRSSTFRKLTKEVALAIAVTFGLGFAALALWVLFLNV
jgi:hypothetical protein